MNPKRLTFLLVVLALSTTLLNSCNSGVGEFSVEIEYKQHHMVDTNIYYSDSTLARDFDLIDSYEVKVSKVYVTDTYITGFYQKVMYIEDKKDIPFAICDMKSRILKEREADKKLSKEIETIRNTQCSP